ncbi:MAG: hypothetical protein LBB48_02920 [Treponema sp.]|jgi:hypothetical protein|nr:hypothetical protein [Treponema sp.]
MNISTHTGGRPGFIAACFAAFFLLISCATAPAPGWAASSAAFESAYPEDKYIAVIGRGMTRELAEAAGAAEIARYFSSHITANTSSREAFSQRDGVTSESLDFESSVYIDSELTVFGVRYARDAFYNGAEKRWQTVAYLDRAEAWAVFEPRFREQADAFRALYRAAETETDPFRKALRWNAAARYAGNGEFNAAAALGQILSPARMNAAFSAVRGELAALPQKTDEARRNAGVYLDCPTDFESIIANAFSRVFAAEGFPVSRARDGARAVCAVTVDEGRQRRELGIFYNPSVQAVITGQSGVLFTFTVSGKSAGAVTPDVAKRRAYRSLEDAVLANFTLAE